MDYIAVIVKKISAVFTTHVKLQRIVMTVEVWGCYFNPITVYLA